MRFFVEQQELNAEVYRTTNIALDRIEQSLAELRRIVDYLLQRDRGN